MIKRYSLPEMEKVWSEESKYHYWLKVELAVCRAMCKHGMIPKADLKNIEKKANFSVDRIYEIEKTTRHDVIAFLTNVAENVGESARYIHYGMTSSDMIDTALALQCRDAINLLQDEIVDLFSYLSIKAFKYKDLLCMGRSHGIHAEPTSFGLKFLSWVDELFRDSKRLTDAKLDITYGQISGAVGNYAHIDPKIELAVCKELNLSAADISTQIISRDRHAYLMQIIALIGTTLEKIALEIRHLQRTEVGEVEEGFAKGQKGSSAMPHKKNPVTSEQICGLARVLRANASAAIENNALWHERDISHSSVERIILPDSFILLHYMIRKVSGLINNLVVNEANIKRNLEMTNGLVFSQIVLLQLAEKGCSREKAYELVQKNAMKCWEKKASFRSLIEKDKMIMNYLTKADLDEIFCYDRYLSNVDNIYKSVQTNIERGYK
ncbi:MAG: adenylosuccinate lyase [Candidatus Cloacimonetes bacterium]|nr:adenylosuccinate lyase [Candidatus Cloacimonadota bacterium]